MNLESEIVQAVIPACIFNSGAVHKQFPQVFRTSALCT